MENLAELPIKELRAMRNKLGFKGVKGESKQSILLQIQGSQYPVVLESFQEKHVKRLARKADLVTKLTPEQITEALQPFMGRGLKVRFDDVSWQVKNGAAEDSGSLTMPINAIVQRVSKVMSARFPAAVTGEFDPMSSAKGSIPVLTL